MTEAGFLGGGVRMSRDHCFVPVFDFFSGMSDGVSLDPFQDSVVFFQTMHRLLKCVAVDLEKAEKMFVEADVLVVVSVKQAFAMELRLIAQARKVNVAAALFVRTARM